MWPRKTSRPLHWLLPGMRVKRYALAAALGMLMISIGVAQLALHTPLWRTITELSRWVVLFSLPNWVSGALWLFLGLLITLWGLRTMNRSLLAGLAQDPDRAAEQVYIHRRLSAGPRIVVMGGGTGLSHVLTGLKNYTANTTAVVTATDDGGSTGRLRRSFGIPAVGDLVDCLSALSDAEQLPELMRYRFSRGDDLSGHTFGNLFLVSLNELSGDFAEALRSANRILALRGSVFPSTPEPARLVTRFEDGREYEGETRLRQIHRRVEEVRLSPANTPVMPEVRTAILGAELLLLGPGSLYTSVIPSFLPTTEVLRRSHGQLVYLVNIMTEAGETGGMDAFAHTEAIIRHLGRKPDVVLVNQTPVPPEISARYAKEEQFPVALSRARFETAGLRLLEADLLEQGPLARHDPVKLAAALVGLTR